jgi:nucleoside-diphosphate kinase
MIHGSDSEESAAREIDIYFEASEICEYTPILNNWSFASDEV